MTASDTIENQLATLNAVGDSAECRGVDEPRDTGRESRHGEGEQTISIHRDAGATSGLNVATNGVQITTASGLEEDETVQGQHRYDDRHGVGIPTILR